MHLGLGLALTQTKAVSSGTTNFFVLLANGTNYLLLANNTDKLVRA